MITTVLLRRRRICIHINFGHAAISLDLQDVVEKIESGLKGETNGWKSRAG